LTDLQRYAWEVSAGYDQGYTSFERGATLPSVALGSQRQYGSIGALLRIGAPGRLSLFGAAFTTERATTEGAPILLEGSEVVTVDDSNFVDRYTSTGAARANALWGVRSLTFERVRGFDALSGVQDMREGFQLGVLAGRSLALLGARDDDMFLSADLYMGGGSPDSYVTIDARGEGRNALDTNRWDG